MADAGKEDEDWPLRRDVSRMEDVRPAKTPDISLRLDQHHRRRSPSSPHHDLLRLQEGGNGARQGFLSERSGTKASAN